MQKTNLKETSLEVKIVYSGPEGSGKTTTIEYLYNKLAKNKKHQIGKLVSIAAKGDRIFFFEFSPIILGRFKEVDLRLKLYTTQGKVEHESTYQDLFKRVDGIVFVADSLASRQAANAESFQTMMGNLAFHDINTTTLPIAFQWNKRDLDPKLFPLSDIEEMENRLNAELNSKSFPASAITGVNIIETLKYTAKETVRSVMNKAKKEGHHP